MCQRKQISIKTTSQKMSLTTVKQMVIPIVISITKWQLSDNNNELRTKTQT